ncbi:GntR family transcriptional regulator [Mycobacterium adipatum]|uniref:GntR family transcriptional regulator n=1 Tax=Mycobacterium adipatum TaxID=1682113 RepID=UPI003983264D
MPKKYGVKEKDLVVTYVANLILTGKLRSGDRLDRNEIAEDLGISRVPVQEAVVQLEHDGIVSTRYHRGAFLHRFDDGVLREHYELYGVLNGIAAGRAAPHGHAARHPPRGARPPGRGHPRAAPRGACPRGRPAGGPPNLPPSGGRPPPRRPPPPPPDGNAELHTTLRALTTGLRNTRDSRGFHETAWQYRQAVTDAHAGPRLQAAIHAAQTFIPRSFWAAHLDAPAALLGQYQAETAAITGRDPEAARAACATAADLMGRIMCSELVRRGVLEGPVAFEMS